MTRDHDALDALRAADRPRPLTDEARRRVEARMLDTFEQARAGGRSADPSESVIDIEGARAGHQPRPRRHRLLVAAAAILAVALVATVSLRDDSDDRVVDVTGHDDDEMDPDVVLAVRTWCRADLGEVRTALGALDGDATDVQRRIALDTLATAAAGLVDILSDLQIPDGARRLQEVGRLSGEAAVLRDGDPPTTAAAVDGLMARFDAELVLLSDGGAACDLPR